MAKAAPRGTQTSRKAGVTSTAKKMDSTRHGFSTEPPSRKVAGASGAEGRRVMGERATATRKAGAASALERMKTTPRRSSGG